MYTPSGIAVVDKPDLPPMAWLGRREGGRFGKVGGVRRSASTKSRVMPRPPAARTAARGGVFSTCASTRTVHENVDSREGSEEPRHGLVILKVDLRNMRCA